MLLALTAVLVRAPHAAALAVVFATLGGCAQPGVLMAQTGEHRLTARDEPSGLSVVLTSGIWTGQPRALAQEWTVLHVLVANLGDTPILLAPGDLELKDERGFDYELFDPGAVFELADPDAAQAGYSRTYHRDYDPGGPVEFEPIVPPGNVAEHALPWGVLQPGTQMRGYVYFETVVAHANRASLTWRFTEPTHERVVDLRFDLYVSRPARKKRGQTSEPAAGGDDSTARRPSPPRPVGD